MNEHEPSEANLRTYIQILRRQIHWVLALTVLAVGAAVAYTTVQKKQYSATAQLLAEPASGTVPLGGTQQTISPTDVLTDLQLITGGPVKTKAEKQLGFLPKISASEVGQTNVIDLTATADTPLLAARVANVYARAFVSYQQTNALNALTAAETKIQGQITAIDNELAPLVAEKSPSSATATEISALTSQQTALQEQLTQLQLAGSESPGGVEVTSVATPPTAPSSPKRLEDALLALVVGLLLGLGVAFSVEYFDDKVYTKEEAERLSGGVPVLAVIPKIKAWKKADRPMAIAELDPFSPVTEAYRSLRTSIKFVEGEFWRKTILVTSASGVEGKTSTVTNLGVIFAKAGERVLMVDCDLRRPRLGSFFGLSETPGFTSVLVGQGDLRTELPRVLQSVSTCPGLTLLGTGPVPPNPAELLGTQKAAEMFKILATGFDVILIDSPPLLPVADAQILAGLADTILLIVMAGATTRAEMERASELLRQVESPPTGILLNKVSRRPGSGAIDYAYGYSYKYRYSPTASAQIHANGNGTKPVQPAPQRPARS